jgi:hypothetical protein
LKYEGCGKWVALTWGFLFINLLLFLPSWGLKIMLNLVRGVLYSRTHVLEKQPTSCSADDIFPSKEGTIKEVLSLGSY